MTIDENRLSILFGCGIRVLLAVFIPQIPVFAAEALTLLLKCLNIPILLRQLVLQLSNLSSTTCLSQFVGLLARSLRITFVALDFLFEAEGVEDHDISAVEDERKEEGEAAEIHVALRVKFAGLHFHAAGAFEHGRTGFDISDARGLNAGSRRTYCCSWS